MIRMTCKCLVLLLGLFLVVSGASLAAERVRLFHDGDTFLMEDGETVRLAGIDTPELGHDGEPDQYYARRSKELALRLAAGQPLRVQPVGAGKDHYRRSLAEVYLPDGKSLNVLLVAEGAAFVYYHPDIPESLLRRLMHAQREAIQGNRGMWQRLLHSSLNEKKYIGNRNSRRFFTDDCREGRRISRKNRVYFKSMTEAFMTGFSPARPCNLWPNEGNIPRVSN